MTVFADIFREYEGLVAKADVVFREMARDYGSSINCRPQCADCCHAVFGLFLVEAAYLKQQFEKLPAEDRQEALARADKADKELRRMEQRLEQRLRHYGDDPRTLAEAMGRERVRCPLLTDGSECLLYPYRPITCRAYGIPTVSGGRLHVCWKSGFKKGQSYPAFNLDAVYKELYRLSGILLEKAGCGDGERASLLFSVAKSISTDVQELITGSSA